MDNIYPGLITDQAGLGRALDLLRAGRGASDLSAAAKDVAAHDSRLVPLSISSISAYLNGQTIPRQNSLVTFLHICGVTSREAQKPWLDAWNRIRNDESERSLRELANAGDSDAASALADAFVQNDRFEEAQELLRKFAKAGDGRAALKLAHLLMRRDHIVEAQDLLHKFVDGAGESAAAKLAEMLVLSGDFDLALNLFRYSVRVGNKNLTSHLFILLIERNLISDEDHRMMQGFADVRTATNREIASMLDKSDVAEMVHAARALSLGVHAATQISQADIDQAQDELPTYVPRDLDSVLRDAIAAAATQGGFIIVVGSSLAGKTRSLFEAVRTTLPKWRLINRFDAAYIRNLAISPRTVIWLDDLQRYLNQDGGLPSRTVRLLIDSGAVIVSTMWPEEYDKRVAPCGPSQSDPYVDDRVLLGMAKVLKMSDVFSEDERLRAEGLEQDLRIRNALDNAKSGRVIQMLVAKRSGRSETHWQVQTRGYGDRPPVVDLLRRGAMIAAVADLISPPTDPQEVANAGAEAEYDRSGPTVIALDGAWGIGKTSLVSLVERQLDTIPRPVISAKSVSRLTVRQADVALGESGGTRKEKDAPARQGSLLWTSKMMNQGDPRAGVPPLIIAHFQPWAHQTSEQVWAGLTTTLLDSIGRTLLPPQAPATERYWFQRNLERVDRMRLRRILRKSALSPLLTVAVLALAAPLVAQMARSTDSYRLASWVIAGSNISLLIAGSLFLSGIAHSLWRYYRRPAADYLPEDLFVGPVPSGINDDAVRDPYHNARSGSLYLAQHDVFKVMDDVKKSGHHLIVFIDDLDRCMPRTTVEVFEAINLFVARSFPITRFVLCLDSTTVAAHLDEVYVSLKSKALHRDDPSSGWSFLRKLIQLPISIPPIAPEHVKSLLDSLLGGIVPEVTKSATVTRSPTLAVEGGPVPTAGIAASLTSSAAVNIAVKVLELDEGVRQRMAERLEEQQPLSVREAKRMLTIWQYYIRVLIHINPAEVSGEAQHLVVVSEIIARWPAVQRALQRRVDGVHGLELLAKATNDWEWALALKELDLSSTVHAASVDGIRDLLERYDGRQVAALAARLT